LAAASGRYADLASDLVLRALFLSGKRLNIQQLQPDRTLSIFIEENCKPVLGRFTDWFLYMFESDVQVAPGAEVDGDDLSRKTHSVPSFNLPKDLPQV
jgi:hypothetical protein